VFGAGRHEDGEPVGRKTDQADDQQRDASLVKRAMGTTAATMV
jgi:hypothetical protein